MENKLDENQEVFIHPSIHPSIPLDENLWCF